MFCFFIVKKYSNYIENKVLINKLLFSKVGKKYLIY